MTKKEKIKLLMNFLGAEQQTRDDFYNKVNQMELPGSEEDQKEMRKAILERFESHFQKYVEQQVALHDKHLSEQAVDASIAFYTSPEGEEIASASVKINNEGEQLALKFTQLVYKDIVDIVEPDNDEDYDSSE